MINRIEYLHLQGGRWSLAGVIEDGMATVAALVDASGEVLAHVELVILGDAGDGGKTFVALAEAAEEPSLLVFEGGVGVDLADADTQSWGRLAPVRAGEAVVAWAAVTGDSTSAFHFVLDHGLPVEPTSEEILPGFVRLMVSWDDLGISGDEESHVLRLLSSGVERDFLTVAVHDGAENEQPGSENVAEDPPAREPMVLENAEPVFRGQIDGIEEGGWAAGWAYRLDGTGKVLISVTVDGEDFGQIVADQFREDLQQAGFRDASCAFWFGIPEEMLDGRSHEINLRYVETGELVPGSPHVFAFTSLQVATPDDNRNIIPNAGFREWPGGLAVSPTDRLSEVLTGWYWDYRRGTEPVVTLSVEKPHGLALRKRDFALSIAVEQGGNNGYMRLVVPLKVLRDDLQRYRFSMGSQRPAEAGDGDLHITEVFIGTISNGNVERISPIKRGLRQRGTQRLLGLRAVAANLLDGLPVDPQFVLVFEFKGEGEMLLFSPELSIGGSIEQASIDVAGAFEDENIRSQVQDLVLSSIWTSRRVAVASHVEGAEPRPSSNPLVSRGQSAVPFIAIVVPVFNASADVEDMLRSIIASTDSPFEVHLFDDGSQEFTAARVSRWETIDPRVRYQRHAENLGYTRNINVALQSVPSEFVVLLNSDTIVTPGWLGKLYDVIAADERIAGVGPLSNAASWQSVPRTKSPQGEWTVNALPHKMTPNEMAALVARLSDGSAPDFPLLNGFCTLLRKRALEEVGYFDDASFPRGYGEENDLCLRLTKAGYTLRVATDAYVFHKKSKSFGHDLRKELSKKANAILRGKHPEVSWAQVEETMRNDPAVNRIRQRLVASLGVEPLG